MADFSAESPLAQQLQQLVQPKLAEYGWTTGGDDTTLFEYILLMVSNGKDSSQVAAELSNDLLDLGPDNPETQEFAQWLFAQIDALQRQAAGGAQSAPSADQTMDGGAPSFVPSGQDTDMDGTSEAQEGMYVKPTSLLRVRHQLTQRSPTGPKAMRNGSGPQSGRGGPRGGRNMLNQMNRQMNRNDDPLHRVRGGGGVGRNNRDPPRGPRGQNLGRGMEAMANGRGMNQIGNINGAPGPMNGMNGMGMGGMPGMPMPPMGGQNGMNGGMGLNQQQQMALMQMYEQQAQMMQQIFSGATPTPYVNPNFNNRGRGGRGGRGGGRGGMHQSTKFTKKEGQDDAMTDGTGENGEGMEVENTRPDPSSTMCKFNLRCTNPDCHFVHQSPAAPPGTTVDMESTCEFGAACKNKKCAGKHPSPAKRQQFQSEQECAFWPNCRDPANCPYKHPSAPPCRNGADCTTPDCKFSHSSVMCKFNPCLNPRCQYKHAPGQKKNNTNVWVAPKEGEHVSERKFIDENRAEELIIPGQDNQDTQNVKTEPDVKMEQDVAL